MSEIRGLLASFRLASPALPIGGFSYSQGLETAIDRQWIHDEASALTWISDCIDLNMGAFEAPLLFSMLNALSAADLPRVVALNQWYLASRETRELHAETLQMGYSMFKLLQDDLMRPSDVLHERWTQLSQRIDVEEALSLPLAWALASISFEISSANAVAAYLWAWAENQVMAAMKCIPLGQQAGQRLLKALSPMLERATLAAPTLPEEQWSNGAPGFVIACAWHETQYSRMFRS